MGRKMLPRPLCAQCGSECKDLGRVFCSRKCRGEHDRGKPRLDMIGNKYAFKGEDVTPWAHYKRMQTMNDDNKCCECGTMEDLVIHHKDHNPKNTTPENLVKMCRGCHINHHRVR